jgi:uncharacterized protein
VNTKNNELTRITVPSKDNPILSKVLKRVNDNEEILTLWKVINVNAINRLKYGDHGIVHFQIVANIALRMARILEKNNIELSIIKDFGLTYNHGEVVVFLASIFHDLGMSINREGHEEYSLIIANSLLKDVLNFLPTNQRTIITSETLQAIINHRDDGKPTTIEAGILRVADALDMGKGRVKVPYGAGEFQIHSLSVAAIENVKIEEGSQKPIKIDILMNNSSGIFQVDDLLGSKIKGSGLENLIEVRAHIDLKEEKKLLEEFKL